MATRLLSLEKGEEVKCTNNHLNDALLWGNKRHAK